MTANRATVDQVNQVAHQMANEAHQPMGPVNGGIHERRIKMLNQQKWVARASNYVCAGTAGYCTYAAASSIVFWPNGVIAGVCIVGGLFCNDWTTDLLKEIDKQIEIEQKVIEQEKAQAAADARLSK